MELAQILELAANDLKTEYKSIYVEADLNKQQKKLQWENI